MTMKVIAAYGQCANGKDTMCDDLLPLLNDKTNCSWERGAFANAVKDTFSRSFNVDREFIEKWKRINEAPDGFLVPIRQALQKIGDGFRQIVPDIWIQIALRAEKNLIISDGRYINESKAVREKNGINILVYRNGFLNNDPNPSEAQLRPLLEYAEKHLPDGPIDLTGLNQYPDGLSYFDVFIKNDSDRDSFLKKSRTLLLPLIKGHFSI